MNVFMQKVDRQIHVPGGPWKMDIIICDVNT